LTVAGLDAGLDGHANLFHLVSPFELGTAADRAAAVAGLDTCLDDDLLHGESPWVDGGLASAAEKAAAGFQARLDDDLLHGRGSCETGDQVPLPIMPPSPDFTPVLMLTFLFMVRSFQSVGGSGTAADEAVAGFHAGLDADVLLHGRFLQTDVVINCRCR
jgi:hypothetical protein